MKMISTLLAWMFLSVFAVSVTAQTGPNSDTPANPTPTPIVSATPPTNDFETDELKTQEQIAAELKRLRAEKAGWFLEKQGLQGTITILERSVTVERERGDFYKEAVEVAKKMDTNAQKIDSNSVIIQTTLEGRIADKNERIAELTDDLRSCQNNQKWIAGISAVGGGFLGWTLKGQTDRFLGTSTSLPSFGLQPLSRPAPSTGYPFTLLKP